MTSQVKLPEPVAYCREWLGDESDSGNMLVEFDKNDLDDETWHDLFTADQMRQFREEGVREALIDVLAEVEDAYNGIATPYEYSKDIREIIVNRLKFFLPQAAKKDNG